MLLAENQETLKIVLAGKVLSEKDEPLSHANVVVNETILGTTTDIDGFFSIELPMSDNLSITIHYIGYESKLFKVKDLDLQEGIVTFVMKTALVSFSPVEVIGEPLLKRDQIIEPSLRMLGIAQLSSIPSIGGGDIFRALQVLPGATSSSELSNQLYVRGGTPDQNLVLINGIPVYQPFHLFGLSSSVDDASVDYVRYYSGGFSVRYGDRLSSVIDIVTKPGNDSLATYLDINPISASFTVSGPLYDKLRWRFSGRRSYFDGLGKAVGTDFPYYFYDIEGKLSYLPNPKSLITLNTFISFDDYKTSYERFMYNPLYKNHPDYSIAHADTNQYRKINKNQLRWSNQLFSVRWTARHNSQQMSEVTLYTSYLGQDLYNQKSFISHPKASVSTLNWVKKMNEDWLYSKRPTEANTLLMDIGIKGFHEFNFRNKFDVSVGGGYSQKIITYDWYTNNFEFISPYINVFMDFPPDSMDYSLDLKTVYGYTEVVKKLFPYLWLRGGVRLANHSTYDKATFDPRFNLTWEFHRDWKFKIGLGKFSQPLSSSTEYGFYSVASLYFPNDKAIPTAHHILARVIYENQQLPNFDITLYQKYFNNILFFDHEGRSKTGEGNSKGLELSINHASTNNFLLRLDYGYTIMQKTQSGETFYPNYDQRHELYTQANTNIGRGWFFGALWTFSTGRPANLAASPAYIGNLDVNIDEFGNLYIQPWPTILNLPKNVFRYPSFHRLDISLSKQWQFKHSTLDLDFQVINLYNRNNVVYYEDIREETEKIPDPDNPLYNIFKQKIVVEAFNGFPFFPTIEVSYEF